jgi:hypothetical protein
MLSAAACTQVLKNWSISESLFSTGIGGLTPKIHVGFSPSVRVVDPEMVLDLVLMFYVFYSVEVAYDVVTW